MQAADSPECERGFSLVEALIAAGLLATVAAGASHLVGRAVQDGAAARARTVAAAAALQKMEQIRSLAWDDDPDLTTNLAGEQPAPGGPGLRPSPAGTLDADVPPYVDHLSADGEWIDPAAAGAAVFARRWSVEPLDGDPATLVLRVIVTRARGPMSRTAARAGPFDVAIVSLRTRHQP